MFGRRYFGGRYLGARYFGDGGTTPVVDGAYTGARFLGNHYFGPRYFGSNASNGGGAATISTGSATITGSTTATVGCTTDTASGTLYALARTGGTPAADSVIIATGQNAAVSSTTPTIAYTGLTASTAYTWDQVQVVSAVNSNVDSNATGTTDTAGGGGGGSPVSHTSTGALASDAATISGNATQAAAGVHSSSGALASQDATIAGTATHLVVHTSSGALASQDATNSGTATTPYVPNTGAGKPRKTRKRKVIVSIDGEEFEVSSEAEAVELLESAKAEAEKKAADVTAKAIAATNRPKRKILADVRKSLTAPKIEVSKPLQAEADKVASAIAQIYADALRAVEISALMRRQADEQDDEDILLMML